MADVINLF